MGNENEVTVYYDGESERKWRAGDKRLARQEVERFVKDCWWKGVKVRLLPCGFIVLPSDSLRLVERKLITYLNACDELKERGGGGLNRVESELAKAKSREYDAVLRGLLTQAYRYVLSGKDVRAFMVFNDKSTQIQYDSNSKTLVISLPQEYKSDIGLLIGKEGRNVKAAQQLLGVKRIQFVLQSAVLTSPQKTMG